MFWNIRIMQASELRFASAEYHVILDFILFLDISLLLTGCISKCTPDMCWADPSITNNLRGGAVLM